MSSLSAIIDTATLARNVATAIFSLRSACKLLRGRLHAVHNEVADLELVLDQFSRLVRGSGHMSDSKESIFPYHLGQARSNLREVHAIVRTWASAYVASQSPFVVKSDARKEQRKLQTLQEDIQTVNRRLSVILEVSNSHDIRPGFPPISAVTTQSAENQIADDIGARVTPYFVSCQTGCPCSCHLQRRSSTPNFLVNILGRLTIGAAGVPVVNPKCDDDACRGSPTRQVDLEYWLPLGFWSTIVRMQVTYGLNMSTSLNLETIRRVPDSAVSVNFAVTGNIEGLKHLFRQGRASPRDVSTTRGYSLLRWALYSKQYTTCIFLLRAGADSSYRPIAASDNSPRIKACHFLLEGGISDEAIEALRAITNGSEYLDDFIEDSRFTLTHKIVLGLSLKPLEEELVVHPEDINAQDSMGRTPLAWAAARGDSRSVVLLLRYGADPNIMDVQLSGPLSNAAAQGHTACVLLLLDAGADPEPALPPGIQKGSPLSVAARNAKNPLLAKRLLDFGANVNSCTTDGRTPLFHAAKNNDTRLAILLLEYGANINYISVAGESPLTMSIIHNSHNVLRLLLERWHEYSVCPRLKGPHLLEIAASYADFETLQILADTDHFRHKYDKHFTIGDFRSRLTERPDMSEKLALAFDELLSIINAAPCAIENDPGLLEAGFFTCLSSRSSKFDQSFERPCPVSLGSDDSDDVDELFHDALP
ncbi:hypothetical protein O1611_g3915 [Lasiodiplodia mahajangana]|uniref:Uncharacterized protein n=1 Tax=Lasiodiplodia mahajangana TaxID=1108764 RepID=A0ACC2JQJ2_9PEZI|nr:hypothetical protein O1611_g3915 [Lasiodiplodia mahajangana]